MQDTLEAVLAHKGSTVYSVDPEDSVLDAVRKMNCEHVGALLVCVDNRMVGIFTERDVLCRVLDAGRDPDATRVAEVMTTEVVTVGPKTGVKDAMAVITERRIATSPSSTGRPQGDGLHRRPHTLGEPQPGRPYSAPHELHHRKVPGVNYEFGIRNSEFPPNLPEESARIGWVGGIPEFNLGQSA